MFNSWMTYQIKQDNNISLRFIILILLKYFEPEKYKGYVEIIEKPEENKIFIQTSNKENANIVLDFLNNNYIIWC